MAVASISSWKVSPAGRSEFVRALSEARKFHEKYGGRVRVWNNSVAGDAVGIVEYWIEHDDFEAYGRFSAALATDREYEQWYLRFTGENATGYVVSTRLMLSVE